MMRFAFHAFLLVHAALLLLLPPVGASPTRPSGSGSASTPRRGRAQSPLSPHGNTADARLSLFNKARNQLFHGLKHARDVEIPHHQSVVADVASSIAEARLNGNDHAALHAQVADHQRAFQQKTIDNVSNLRDHLENLKHDRRFGELYDYANAVHGHMQHAVGDTKRYVDVAMAWEKPKLAQLALATEGKEKIEQVYATEDRMRREHANSRALEQWKCEEKWKGKRKSCGGGSGSGAANKKAKTTTMTKSKSKSKSRRG